MRVLIAFFLLTLPAKFSFAQLYNVLGTPSPFSRRYIDSVHNVYLHEKNETAKVQLLNTMARGYMLMKYPDSVLWYAQEALQLAHQINDLKGEMEASTYLVRCLWQRGDYPKALDLALRNLHLAESTKDSLAVYDALRQVCFSYDNMKDYRQLLEYGRRSRNLVYSQFFKDKNELAFRMLSGYINFLGDAFDGLNDMDSALYFRRLGFQLSIKMQRGHGQGMAIAASELGDTFLRLNNLDSASFYYNMAISYADRSGVRDDLTAASQFGLAKIFFFKNRDKISLHYARLAIQTFKKLNLTASELEAVTLLKNIHAAAHQYKEAYEYASRGEVLKDSLYNVDKIKAIDSIKFTEALGRQQLIQQDLRHQVNEATMQKNLQLVKLEKASLIRNALVLCLLVLFFAAALVYRNIILKRKNERILNEKKQTETEQQKSELEMQALRAQMNPHFIFNSLTSVNRFILENNKTLASQYLTKFSRLMRLILENSQSALIPLEKELEALELYLELELVRFGKRLEYRIVVEDELALEEIKVPPLIIQPYVENAILHGLMNKDGNGRLLIELYQAGHGTVNCKITDDGVGRMRAAELKSKTPNFYRSMGMEITANRIAAISRNMQIDTLIKITDATGEDGTACGTRVLLKIPVTYD